MSNTEKQDIYTRITSKVISSLERGVRPWTQPWNAEHAAGKISRPLRHNGQPYSGINILMLWASAMEQGFAAPIWMTFKQAQQLGAGVRKGAKGSLVVYANAITRTEHNEDTGEDVERAIPFLRGYTVFNVEQIDGLPDLYYAKAEPRLTPIERIAHCEEFFSNTHAAINYSGGRAFYEEVSDRIQMPPMETFTDAECFYATLAHEMTHWTKHETRLKRDFGHKHFADEGYAREELVAELGSAFLCADLELMPEPREDHASYIASWIRVLENDKRCIVQAASYAQKAADFLHGLQPQPGVGPSGGEPTDVRATEVFDEGPGVLLNSFRELVNHTAEQLPKIWGIFARQ